MINFWPKQTYVLHTSRTKEYILKTLSIYTIPGEPVITRRIKGRNRKFVGIMYSDGFEIAPIPEYGGRGIMPYFQGIVVEKDGQSEIVIQAKFSQLDIGLLIAMAIFLIIIWVLLLTTQTALNFVCFFPGLFFIWLYIILLIGFNLGLAAFKKRFKQVFFDLF